MNYSVFLQALIGISSIKNNAERHEAMKLFSDHPWEDQHERDIADLIARARRGG
ncbi:hypothetical protein [Enterovibrio baiacu]|uniref:hypothetical protein n=1 Tax=Enterovibrio baiacu TaxID=2491023 RepID=UPI0013869925|nr:hypothetical protein [Enterovibrio baiacu]